jgi:RNA polymerase sigma-70 factor (ECF subfamily)
MSEAQRAAQIQSPDPTAWVDQHGDYLFRYAVFRLRDVAVAEDVVQETLLAALQAYQSFAGRGSERTWLVGILKHKIIDHFRRRSRETPFDPHEGESLEHHELFMQTGEWVGHWVAVVEPDKAHLGPIEWNTNPAALLEQSEFWEVFNRCLSALPARIASAFTLREMDGLRSEEICEVLSISNSNLWVMLYRARTHLRHCIELNWFRREPTKQSR